MAGDFATKACAKKTIKAVMHCLIKNYFYQFLQKIETKNLVFFNSNTYYCVKLFTPSI